VERAPGKRLLTASWFVGFPSFVVVVPCFLGPFLGRLGSYGLAEGIDAAGMTFAIALRDAIGDHGMAGLVSASLLSWLVLQTLGRRAADATGNDPVPDCGDPPAARR
jgi:hypothetical protein